MAMSKRDFIALADLVRNAEGTKAQFNDAQIALLAGYCKYQNPAFMEDRWMDYAAGLTGPNGGKRKTAA
jgi:hypothetical protein